MSSDQPTVPHGYCQCGCGDLAPVAERTHRKYGYVKGQPKRFIRGHAFTGHTQSAAAREKSGSVHRGRPKSPEQRAKMSAAQRGALGSQWTGGKIVREGRVLLYVGREHPMADTYGYAYEHRIVFALAAGRMLTSREQVHHVDLLPANNALDNLVVLTRSEHRRVHNFISQRGMDPMAALREAVCP